MIRALVTAALLSLAAALPARAIDIQQVTSPGGIPAWLVEDHSIPFVALNIAFRGGASVDAPSKRGAVNLMTALLEEGAGERVGGAGDRLSAADQCAVEVHEECIVGLGQGGDAHRDQSSSSARRGAAPVTSSGSAESAWRNHSAASSLRSEARRTSA